MNAWIKYFCIFNSSMIHFLMISSFALETVVPRWGSNQMHHVLAMRLTRVVSALWKLQLCCYSNNNCCSCCFYFNSYKLKFKYWSTQSNQKASQISNGRSSFASVRWVFNLFQYLKFLSFNVTLTIENLS